jgi:hypothetical protein
MPARGYRFSRTRKVAPDARHFRAPCVCGVLVASSAWRADAVARGVPVVGEARMSALIWLAIVGVWGFVLIPMWLRHHDGAFEQQSSDRFSTAMRVLARRGRAGASSAADKDQVTSGETDGEDDERAPRGDAGDAGRAPDGPGRAADPAAAAPDMVPGGRPAGDPDADPTAHTVAVGPARPVAPPRRVDPGARTLRRLRRQRLVVLVAAVPVSITLAATLSGMWIVVQLLVDASLGLYLAHLRRTARTESRLAASRAARDRRIAADRVARHAARPVPATGTAAARAVAPPPAARPGRTGSTAQAGRPHVAAGGRPSSPEYAPVRLSADERPLTPEEVAVAGAETVDLGGVAAQAVDAALAAGGETPAPASEAPRPVGGPQHDGSYTNNVRITPPRPAGRPTVRSPTSRPGRVQINPPGTHGGLTPPPAAAPAQPPEAPVGEATAKAEDGASVQVLRPAVGS